MTRSRAVTAIFALSIFTSAALLFFVELMIGKMLLPIFGGAPAVWITCMVFFQVALLAGYAWAHVGSTLLGTRMHARIHLAIVGGAIFLLPLAVRETARSPSFHEMPPALAILSLLTVAVGLPFFVLSTTSPLIQRWFAAVKPDADPYALYAASNLGSLVALLGYPTIVEWWIGLGAQSWWWTRGYVVLAFLLLSCAAILFLTPTAATTASAPPPDAAPTIARRARWVLLAAIPSSHMLGATSYLTTDIAPIPLLWVLPLALYLLTFIFVFSAKNPLPVASAARALPFFAAVAALLLFAEANRPLWLVVPVHLGAFFLGAMVCHGVLAADRPSPARLTAFYLWLSVGGVAGGLFNAVFAPIAFDGLAEYPLAIVLACAMRPSPSPEKPGRRDLAWAAVVGAATLVLVLVWESLGREPDRVSVFLLFCLPILAAYRNLRFPIRFALCLAAIFAASAAYTGAHGKALLAQRGFFGALRVTMDRDGLHRLVHGGTVHGRQHRTDTEMIRVPIDYYSRTGPVGDVFRLVQTTGATPSIAGVGLGVGEIAVYALPGETWTFYEIDPLISRIATDAALFTYLGDAFPNGADIRLGDARLELESAEDGAFDLIVLDAFSSDAIPLHLITREAIALYLRKLAPGGVLAFHVSNNFVELEPVLANLADDAGLTALTRADTSPHPEELRLGKLPSRWVALSHDASRLEPLTRRNWNEIPRREDVGLWTDDHSNLVRVLSLF